MAEVEKVSFSAPTNGDQGAKPMDTGSSSTRVQESETTAVVKPFVVVSSWTVVRVDFVVGSNDST
jgi:hypothetical protein